MIERKFKICKGFGEAEGHGCGRSRYLFSHGLCSYCHKIWQLKTGKVKIRKPTGELAMFNEIWIEREHVSFLSGLPLDEFQGTPYYVNMFAHVLDKKKYPSQRLIKTNVILLTPQEHFYLDQGTKDQRDEYAKDMENKGFLCDWIKIFKLKEKLLLEMA